MLLITMLPVPDAAAQGVHYDGAVSFTTGSYGLPTVTTQYGLTSGLVFEWSHIRVGASIPIYAQNGATVVTTGAGRVSRSEQTTVPPSSGGGGPGHGVEETTTGYETGFGDPLAQASWTIPLGAGTIVTTGGSLKIPVAQPQFGTGEVDYGVSADATQLIGAYALGVGAAWWFLGDGPNLELWNPWVWGLSVSRGDVGGGSATIGLYGSTPWQSGAAPALSGSVSYSRTMSPARAFVSAGLGFTESSSDFALSIGWRVSLGR